MLGVVDDFRTADWLEIVKYPELVYQKSTQYLQILKLSAYLHIIALYDARLVQ